MQRDDRESFEQDYRDWIRLMSRDAAFRLSALPPENQNKVLKAYENFRDPLAVFRSLSEAERVSRLAGEQISSFILIETDAITFFPSVYSAVPGIQDFAVVMNRRFYCQGLWYPIISLNSEYMRQSSDRLLTFALEHEFEMNRIYLEITSSLRGLSRDEKRDAAVFAEETTRERTGITREELMEDELLMLRLSRTMPLLPKPYAEMAMQLYIESGLSDMHSIGQKSRSPEEESFGEELYREFQGWSKFSQETYELFVREIRSNLREANLGYS